MNHDRFSHDTEARKDPAKVRRSRYKRIVKPNIELLAPRWHTAVLVFVMACVATAGALTGSVAPSARAGGQSRITDVYAPMILVQWLMLAYVCRVGRTRSALRALLGRGWNGPTRAFADMGWAAALVALILATEFAFAGVWGSGHDASGEAFLPRTPAERGVWVLVAVSAGFCEELVYRGYLQTQLTAFTGYASIAIFLQAGLFGAAHGEQGALAALRFAFYGIVFGVLCRSRQSLVPGIIGHVFIDLMSGLQKA